jgi:hypothetical protein
MSTVMPVTKKFHFSNSPVRGPVAYVAKKDSRSKKKWKLPIPKWLLNSRWPPKFDLILKYTNRLFYQFFFS